MKHRMTACILSALMTLSAVTYTAAPAAGEEKEVEYGTVTVTVYDGETGELFQNDQVRIMVAGFNAESASMFTPHYIYGMWYTSETNPYTASEVELYPGWEYEVTVMNDSEVYSENPYYYAIDESRSDTVIQFSDGVAEPVNIYIVKKYDAGAVGGIWIYRGTTAAEQYPVFEQYYPDDDGSYAHRRICCQSALDKTLSYGDILVTEDIVNPSNRILTEDVAWTENGSCYDLPDIRSLTVMSEDPFSQSILLKRTGWFSGMNTTAYSSTPRITAICRQQCRWIQQGAVTRSGSHSTKTRRFCRWRSRSINIRQAMSAAISCSG